MKTKKYTNYKRIEIMAYEHPQIQRFYEKWGFNYLSNIRQTKPELTRGSATNAMDGKEQPFTRDKSADSYSHRERKQTFSSSILFSPQVPCESSLDEMFIGGMR